MFITAPKYKVWECKLYCYHMLIEMQQLTAFLHLQQICFSLSRIKVWSIKGMKRHVTKNFLHLSHNRLLASLQGVNNYQLLSLYLWQGEEEYKYWTETDNCTATSLQLRHLWDYFTGCYDATNFWATCHYLWTCSFYSWGCY